MLNSASRRLTLLCVLVSSVIALAGCKKEDKNNKPKPTKKAPAIAKVPARTVDGPKPSSLPKLPALKIPATNPQTPEKIKLGHQLFFDKRLSVDGSRSCYSCHQNENGNGGAEPRAIGAKEKQLSRHSPVIWNIAYLSKFYWDGRSGSMEAQVKGAWGGGNMGVGKANLAKKAAEIAKIEGYKTQFAKVFPKAGVTPDTIAQAIASFERTLICKDTAYDKYAAGDVKALNDEQKTGLNLYMGKAMCVSCHAPPFFSIAMNTPDAAFFNVGIGTKGVAEDKVDIGRMKITKKPEDWASFKIPSLRNVAKSAPYFHDGSVKSLTDAVKLMASGGHANKNLSKLVADRKLTAAEVKSLVAFLGALDCNKSIPAPTLPK